MIREIEFIVWKFVQTANLMMVRKGNSKMAFSLASISQAVGSIDAKFLAELEAHPAIQQAVQTIGGTIVQVAVKAAMAEASAELGPLAGLADTAIQAAGTALDGALGIKAS